ncbi:hypothetical protein DFH06DRAFT_1320932 [Mycena polygramma]|nr:hypothetical protein DFH06DRAFT_1320932 [Mycena polygramma]
MDSSKDTLTANEVDGAKPHPARDDKDDKVPALEDLSDDEMPPLDDMSDDEVPPLMDYDDLPDFADFGKKPKTEQKSVETRNGRYPFLTFPIFISYAHDMTFRLPTSTIVEADPVLVDSCTACRPGTENTEHEGNVWRKAERPCGEYLEWKPCTGQRQGFRTDGEAVERAWAFTAPVPIAKPVLLRAKL